MNNGDRLNTTAQWVALLAAFIIGAVAEYRLAIRVGYDQYTAGLLPFVLDVWGFAAMRSGRTPHIVGALLAMFGVQTVSHLLDMAHTPAHMVALSIAVSAIPPMVSLACHRMAYHAGKAADTPAETTPERSAVDLPGALWEAEDDETEPTPEPKPEPEPAAKPLTTRELARRALEMRAQGHKWDEVAATLGRSRQHLHKACKRHFPQELTALGRTATA